MNYKLKYGDIVRVTEQPDDPTIEVGFDWNQSVREKATGKEFKVANPDEVTSDIVGEPVYRLIDDPCWWPERWLEEVSKPHFEIEYSAEFGNNFETKMSAECGSLAHMVRVIDELTAKGISYKLKYVDADGNKTSVRI